MLWNRRDSPRFQPSAWRNSEFGSSLISLRPKAIGSDWEKAIASKRYSFSGRVIKCCKCRPVHSSVLVTSGLSSQLKARLRGGGQFRSVIGAHSPVEILSGLKEGDTVIPHPDETVVDGKEVESRS